jgi:metal-dependent HD superfamily phosphatase/phosphodiesterase
MSQREEKQQQIKSLDDLGAFKAKEHLEALEKKIKIRQEAQQQKQLETSLKAQHIVEQSRLGYDKHTALFDSISQNNILQVIKKQD